MIEFLQKFPKDRKLDIYYLCEKNPEKWKMIAKDCIDNMPFDDLEDACRRNSWKLPLKSYQDYWDLVRPHILEICRQDPTMWENVVRTLIDYYMPVDFIEYLSEEYGWQLAT